MNSYEMPDGATFRKASGCADKNCVEVAAGGGIVGIRDSTTGQHGPVLAFTRAEWTAFLGGAKNGEFDLR